MRFGDMTPEQQKAMTREAVGKLNEELNHPAMRRALDMEVQQCWRKGEHETHEWSELTKLGPSGELIHRLCPGREG